VLMRGSACKATELNYPVKGDREKNILMSLAFLKECDGDEFLFVG